MHKTAKYALLSSQQNAEDLTENALLKIAWEFSENCEMSRWLTKKIERKEKVDEGSSDPTLSFLFRDLSAFCVQGDWKLKRCARMEEGSHTWGRGKNTHCLQHLSFNGVFPSRPATSWMDWKLRGHRVSSDAAASAWYCSWAAQTRRSSSMAAGTSTSQRLCSAMERTGVHLHRQLSIISSTKQPLSSRTVYTLLACKYEINY